MRPLHLSPEMIEILGFPGEIMLRLLKMLVLPLVAGSMVAGKCLNLVIVSRLTCMTDGSSLYFENMDLS